MARVLIFFFLASVCTQVLVLLLLHLLVDKKEFAQRIPADIDRPIEVELFFPIKRRYLIPYYLPTYTGHI